MKCIRKQTNEFRLISALEVKLCGKFDTQIKEKFKYGYIEDKKMIFLLSNNSTALHVTPYLPFEESFNSIRYISELICYRFKFFTASLVRTR